MTERKTTPKKPAAAKAKQEMQETYAELVSGMEEAREAAATPAQKVAEKAVRQAVAVADELTAETIIRNIGGLKGEVGKLLTSLSDRLEQETARYEAVKRAIVEKEAELAEIYEIQKASSSLAALIEAQTLKKDEYEAEMAARKEALTREIEATRAEWLQEKAQRAAEQKEADAAEAKRRATDKEEFDYNLNRERRAAQDAFAKEQQGYAEDKARLEREIALHREQTDREFAEREQSLLRQEQELAELRARVAAFPKELDTAVAREVKTAVDKVKAEETFRLELTRKEFEGERNVLQAQIASLESLVKDQSAQVAKLNEQVEKSYAQVQSIAFKAVEGSAAKSVLVAGAVQKQGE